jgi:hypothetical protein
MERDIRIISNSLRSMKRVKGKAKLIEECNRYLSNCGGWNPLIEEELIKIHKRLVHDYTNLIRIA